MDDRSEDEAWVAVIDVLSVLERCCRDDGRRPHVTRAAPRPGSTRVEGPVGDRSRACYRGVVDFNTFRGVVLGTVEVVSLLIEILAVAIIVIAIFYASILFLVRRGIGDAYTRFRIQLGRALLLGLEVLVAADIIRTVALEPSIGNVVILGLLVLIRTFLSWSLVVEIEDRWPWQQRPSNNDAQPPGV